MARRRPVLAALTRHVPRSSGGRHAARSTHYTHNPRRHPMKFLLAPLIILTTLAVGLFLLAFQRVAIEPEAAYRLRYGYSIVILISY